MHSSLRIPRSVARSVPQSTPQLTLQSPLRLPLHLIVRLTPLFAATLGLSAAQQIHGAPTPPAAPAQGDAAPQGALRPGNAPRVAVTAPIVSNVELVNFVFSVQDKRGGFVPGLKAADFRVFEDNRPQTIRFFTAEEQVPLTLGLLLDTSPSQGRVLSEEQRLSDAFFQHVLGSKDLAFVLGFDVDTRILQDLTASKSLLRAAIDGAHIGGGGVSGLINPGPFPNQSSGATHLWDAIVLACHERLAPQVGRKAIIVITDGVDEGSHYSDAEALRALLETNVILYVIVASDASFYGGYGGFSMVGGGAARISKLAEASGGHSFRADERNMSRAFDQIASELRSQYTLAYHSDRPQRDGSFRKVRIELAAGQQAGHKVRARRGYYALPATTP